MERVNRISDEELDAWIAGGNPIIVRMGEELRERRAQDLSAEERETLLFGDPRYSCRVGSDELLALLLAIKRMLPVVRAAEAWRDDTQRTAVAVLTEVDLLRAIDSLRREMGSK